MADTPTALRKTTAGTRVAALLAGLGEDEDQVAGSLREAGVAGFRQNKYGCPIASYLRSRLGAENLGYLAVTGTFVHVSVGGAMYTVDNPGPVRTFVRLFDAGSRFGDLAQVEP